MLKYSHDAPAIKSDLFQAIGVVPSLKCNIKCAHCSANAGPDRVKELGSDEVCRALDEAAKLGEIRHVCISGGEPFIYKDLIKIVQRAGRRFPQVAVLTNCGWATDLDTAKKTLFPLADAGVKCLGVSADDFHQEFLPIQRVRNAIAAAHYFGVGVVVQSSGNPKEPITEEELKCFNGRAYHNRSAIYKAGRAEVMSYSEYPPSFLEWHGCPRGELFPTVVPSGNVYACDLASFRIQDKTHHMVLGNVHDEPLNEILQKVKADPIFEAFTSGGFKRLVDVVSAAGLAHKLRPTYPHVCDLCVHLLGDVDMRAALQKFYSGEKVHVVPVGNKDIAVREFERAELKSLYRKSNLPRRNKPRQPKPTRHVELIPRALEVLDKALVNCKSDDIDFDAQAFYNLVHLAVGPEWTEVC